MNFHPVSKVFPLLEGAAFDALVEDIRKNGQREPIILHEGMILEGRNRWRACQRLGLEAKTSPWDGVGTPLEFVVTRNLHRKSLGESERALLADDCSYIGPRGNPPKGWVAPNKLNGQAVHQRAAARLFNVGRNTVARANRVRSRGLPELVEAMEAGRISVNAAFEMMTQPEHKQLTFISKRRDARDYAGTPIKLPAGLDAEAAARRGLKMEQDEGMWPEQVAPRLGVPHQTYRYLRDMLMLKEHKGLSAPDRRLVEQAWDLLRDTERIGKPYAMVADLVVEVWGEGAAGRRRNSKTLEQRLSKFETAVEVLLAACEGAGELEIPYLSSEQRKELVARVTAARKGVLAFEGRLRGENEVRQRSEPERKVR